MQDGIPSPNGKQVWTPTAMAQMLHNECYMGDIRMQKSYISDPISHVRVDNRDAKLNQYYKEDHHPAIVPKNEFKMVQMILTMKDLTRGMWQYPYYGILKCPICGANMVRFNVPRKNNLYAWTCGGKESAEGNLRKNRTACPPYFFVEHYINKGYWEAMMALDKDQLQAIANGGKVEKAEAAKEILRFLPESEQDYPPIEYQSLCLTVKKIQFPQWDTIRIIWKCGLTSEARMVFQKVGDHGEARVSLKTQEKSA